MSTILPPGVSRAVFNKACDELRAIVGREWVFTDETSLVSYRDPYYPGDPMEHTPSGTVAPINVEQVQGVSYRGAGRLITDMLGGQLAVGMGSLPALMAQAGDGNKLQVARAGEHRRGPLTLLPIGSD